MSRVPSLRARPLSYVRSLAGVRLPAPQKPDRLDGREVRAPLCLEGSTTGRSSEVRVAGRVLHAPVSGVTNSIFAPTNSVRPPGLVESARATEGPGSSVLTSAGTPYAATPVGCGAYGVAAVMMDQSTLALPARGRLGLDGLGEPVHGGTSQGRLLG